MSENIRRPILYKGEELVSRITKKGFGLNPKSDFTFEEARIKIMEDIEKTKQSLSSIPAAQRLPNEIVFCMRLQSQFIAKSYYPETLFARKTNDVGFEDIGSRIWRNEDSQSKPGKLLFVRSTMQELDSFKQKLNIRESNHDKKFVADLIKLSSIGLLTPKELALGFDADWQAGMIEAVIHPFNIDKEVAIEHFQKTMRAAGVKDEEIKYKRYNGGITFVSLQGNKEILNQLSNYNPLRTMHPLVGRDFSKIMRVTPSVGSPLPPTFTKKPSITLGILDGGFKSGNDSIDNYVEAEDSVLGTALAFGTEHGTHVTSAALYGPLNHYNNTEQLPEPSVFVKNFRIISDLTTHHELYESIDAIEKIIPNNPEIKVYNLSLGPRGPILDDCISRFTFSCDQLSQKYKVLFCSAVGNDGDQPSYNRIQAPSDMVNGLAIGAYKIDAGIKQRAEYSCVGPGREGNKLKPDVVAFGGCDKNPTHLLSCVPNSRSYTQGTSFSSPIVANYAAQLIGGSKNIIDSLVARALIIHSANRKSAAHCLEMGHGSIPDNIEDIAVCPANSYTLIYKGEINPRTYVSYEIPFVPGITGKVKFRWTMAVLTKIDPLSPDDYTSTSIEVSFFPNSQKFSFTHPITKKVKKLNISKDKELIAKLISEGWKQSKFPASDSKNPYANETELRSLDFKWDTLDYKENSKNANNIDAPVFHVHAMDRGKRTLNKKVKFALILTVEAPKSKIDLYSNVIKNYLSLSPLNLKLQNRISIRK